MEQKTLLIGLGNPILGDDGIGWRIVNEVQMELKENPHISNRQQPVIEYLSLGGLALMEHMIGYHDVIVVDSIVTKTKPIGTIYSLPLSQLPNLSAGHTTSSHDASLATALDVGRHMDLDVPEDVWVVAVEAEYVYEFSEELSSDVEASIPKTKQIIMDILLKDIREEKVYGIT